MGRLIYLFNVSLDGFVETPDRSLDWTAVDDELHSWFNEQERSLAASLYGRRLYELMAGHWLTAESDPNLTATEIEYAAIWRAVPKVVFSTTLTSVGPNARLVRGDVGDVLAQVRSEFDGDIGVGGATLAEAFVRRGLVDEYRLVVHPVAIGGGRPYFPPLDAPLLLRLLETRTFGSGVVYLRYETA